MKYRDMNPVERIIELCKIKDVKVSKMEKDLDYGNGYLNPKKINDLKVGRLFEMLNYLGVTLEEFYFGEKNPATDGDGKVADQVEDEKHTFVNGIFDQLNFENQIRAANALQSLLQDQLTQDASKGSD